MRLFNIFRNLLAIWGLISLGVVFYGAFIVAKSYGLPPRLFVLKALKKVGLESSFLAEVVKPPPLRSHDLAFLSPGIPDWQGHGARPDRILAPQIYDVEGRPVPSSWGSLQEKIVLPAKETNFVEVADAKDFLAAIRHAQPGDVITLQQGIYKIKERSIYISAGGTSSKPITVRAEKLGDVYLELNSLEGFFINSPYWIFENLDIKGTCGSDDSCEHAFHIVGDGKGFVLRNNRIHEFNSMIKANGTQKGEEARICPDNALLQDNSFYNSRARQTSNPVSFIDVVCPDHWILHGNFIADFQKAEGDQISYGVQVKGNSSHGVFENNLVIGEYRTTGGVRVGLSFGGGGTGKNFARDGDNRIEHSSGVVRNNIVMYLSDVGLYLNKANDTKVFNNIFYKTSGIDIRFPESSAEIANNLLSGGIRNRDGGSSSRKNNLVRNADGWPLHFRKRFDGWFMDPAVADFSLKNGKEIVDKGEPVDDLWEDFCGNPRDHLPDIGAIEFGVNSPCMPLGDMK